MTGKWCPYSTLSTLSFADWTVLPELSLNVGHRGPTFESGVVIYVH